MKNDRAYTKNPFPYLIADDIYELLYSEGFIKDIPIRDFLIRKQFRQLRAQKIRHIDAIYIIQDDYKFLQFDTLRKIAYGFSQKEIGGEESRIVDIKNPLSDFISDEIFDLLNAQRLLSDTPIRDYLIRKQFRQLRSRKVCALEAMHAVQDIYQYLQVDSIRKIVYG